MEREATYTTMRVELDGGVIVATIDQPGRTLNAIDRELLADLGRLIDRLEREDAVGLVLTSGKQGSFIAGADLDMLAEYPASPAEIFPLIWEAHQLFRRLETVASPARKHPGGHFAKPVAAVLRGDLLGGGFELALACHARFAPGDARFSCGFPEVQLGLIPGGGGTQRTSRLAGMPAAVDLIISGRRYDAATALNKGLVTEVAPDAELEARAIRWVRQAGPVSQPWDRPGFAVPGGAGMSPKGFSTSVGACARLSGMSQGNSPAAEQALAAIWEGSLLQIDVALRLEAKRFALCLGSTQARMMIRALFHDRTALEKGTARPAGIPPHTIRKMGVLGSGLMGSGIAYIAARAGIEVVVIDRDEESSRKAVDYARRILDRLIGRGRLTEEAGRAVLSRLVPSTDYAALAGADLVIEAVFEDLGLKRELLRKAEQVVGPNAILASNTSTLPISHIATALERPERFIGMHFFSPVEAMPLLELIPGEKTGEQALAMGFDFNRMVRKIPIVVRDVRGFYTNRIVPAYLHEAMLMVMEGVSPALVENAALALGMPIGPLAVIDELTLELVYNICETNRKEQGKDYVPNGTEEWLGQLVHQLGRRGKRFGGGFYDYPADAKRRLWPGLAAASATLEAQPERAEVVERLLYAQLVPAVRGITEDIVQSRAEADVGAIFGWGFPAWTGGPISYVESIGAERFIASADALARKFGPRFSPPRNTVERISADTW
ncbi:Fatty acid oxidation complex subunit alpha [compost metagenome]